eukprot:scaffold6957_cov96-Isochrysis_galbana.AAC.3
MPGEAVGFLVLALLNRRCQHLRGQGPRRGVSDRRGRGEAGDAVQTGSAQRRIERRGAGVPIGCTCAGVERTKGSAAAGRVRLGQASDEKSRR